MFYRPKICASTSIDVFRPFLYYFWISDLFESNYHVTKINGRALTIESRHSLVHSSRVVRLLFVITPQVPFIQFPINSDRPSFEQRHFKWHQSAIPSKTQCFCYFDWSKWSFYLGHIDTVQHFVCYCTAIKAHSVIIEILVCISINMCKRQTSYHLNIFERNTKKKKINTGNL